MSIFLVFCVLAAAGWLLLSVTNRGSSDRPDASVAAYSRAMAALGSHRQAQQAHPASRRRPPASRQRPRTGAPVHRRPTSTPRTTTRR